MYKTPICSSFFPYYCLPSGHRVLSKYLQFSKSAMFSMSMHLFSFSSSILFIWPTSGILWVSAQISSSFPKAYPGLLRIHCYLLLLSILDLSIFLVVLPIFNVLFNVLALFVSHIVFVLKFIFLLLIQLYQLPSG